MNTADRDPPPENERPRAQVLNRVFKLGPREFVDLAPHLEPAESLKLYEGSNPILKFCTLGEPSQQGDSLVFPIEKPPVQTKGTGG
jgi:hypothetical protein